MCEKVRPRSASFTQMELFFCPTNTLQDSADWSVCKSVWGGALIYNL